MLHIHFANRFETLTALLLQQLAAGRGGPFDVDTLVVPSAAVQRALTLAIADHDGICANVRFDYLARWLWRQVGRLVPEVADESPFDAAVLVWRVHAALCDAAFVAEHPPLANYLQRADDVMRFELAQRIAGLLEQYVTYRADWLEAWQRGQPAALGAATASAGTRADERADERWQAALWRRLSAELGLATSHPAAAFAEALRTGTPSAIDAAGVPPVSHVFALPTMPPLHLGLLQQLGRAVEVHLYVLNPCQEYWFELIDARRLAHLAARGRAAGHEVGNRLLAAWGQQTQSHIDLLIERAGDAANDDGVFEPNPAGTLLAALQNAVLTLTELAPGSVPLAPADRSLELHVCHSLTRELEVLHDHLLGLFVADAARPAGRTRAPLRPSDILVVVPDLEAAAPLIDAVFGTVPKDRAIPYAVTGRARSRVNAPARALLGLLALAGSRFAASDVFGWLQQPIVARRFGLDDEALAQVHAWMLHAGMRWGIDGAHRATFDLPPDPRHTLADGLDRLFLGYALPAPGEGSADDRPPDAEAFAERVNTEDLVAERFPAAELFAARVPAGDAEGSEALALGAFWACIDALAQLQAALKVPQRPSAWGLLLNDALAQFLAPAGDELDDQRELQAAIRTLTATMQRAGVVQPLPLAVLRAALEQGLDDPARGGVPTGGVTFSSMTSLRNLPFRVVCALGLNDGVFPSAQRPPEFDLMALHPRRGDRQRRADERNLFLDLLLAARDSLYLSHTGRSVRDNAPRPPSVLVAELLDTVLPAIVDAGQTAGAADSDAAGNGAWARHRLVVEHPLQPFSLASFSVDAEPRLRSFDGELAAALRAGLADGRPADVNRHADGEPGGDRSGEPPIDPDLSEDSESDSDDDSDSAADLALPPFFNAPLAAPGAELREVGLAQLIAFFRNPSRHLLRHRLGLDLPRDADALRDDEPLLPDRDGRIALAQRLLPPLLAGAEASQLQALARAGPEMPGGAIGARELARELVTLERFAQRVRAATREPLLEAHTASLGFEIDGEPWQLHATFTDLRPSGLVRWRCDETRVGDRLDAWLHQLVLAAAPPPHALPRSRWLLRDGTLAFTVPEQPRELLRTLLQLYRQGLREPLHFFPRSAWAYSDGASLSKATQAWQVTKDRPHGEAADAAHRLALRGCATPLDAAFRAAAEAVFGPLRRHLADPANPA